MRSGRTQEQLNDVVHQHYVSWFTGDGATVEFTLPRDVAKLEDLMVTVAGAVLRPDLNGTVYDYKVRGITPGYSGDRNRVKLNSAPANGANVGLFLTAD